MMTTINGRYKARKNACLLGFQSCGKRRKLYTLHSNIIIHTKFINYNDFVRIFALHIDSKSPLLTGTFRAAQDCRQVGSIVRVTTRIVHSLAGRVSKGVRFEAYTAGYSIKFRLHSLRLTHNIKYRIFYYAIGEPSISPVTAIRVPGNTFFITRV